MKPTPQLPLDYDHGSQATQQFTAAILARHCNRTTDAVVVGCNLRRGLFPEFKTNNEVVVKNKYPIFPTLYSSISW